jgi:hypothetical protein
VGVGEELGQAVKVPAAVRRRKLSSSLALKSEFLAVADRAQRLLAFIKDVGPSRASAILASVVAAFAGAGASGGGAASAFVFSPVFTMPKLSGKDAEVVFVIVLFRGGRAVIYDAEVLLTSPSSAEFSTAPLPLSALWRRLGMRQICKSWWRSIYERCLCRNEEGA